MKATKNILKFFTVLLFLIVGIILIQFFSGEPPYESQRPVTPTETTEVGLILDIPQKALWRNYVHISAEATPGTTCELHYIPPSGKSQEFYSAADKNGKCTWKWKIEETDGKGNARLIFTIDGKSETHFIEIRRSF